MLEREVKGFLVSRCKMQEGRYHEADGIELLVIVASQLPANPLVTFLASSCIVLVVKFR